MSGLHRAKAPVAPRPWPLRSSHLVPAAAFAVGLFAASVFGRSQADNNLSCGLERAAVSMPLRGPVKGKIVDLDPQVEVFLRINKDNPSGFKVLATSSGFDVAQQYFYGNQAQDYSGNFPLVTMGNIGDWNDTPGDGKTNSITFEAEALDDTTSVHHIAKCAGSLQLSGSPGLPTVLVTP